MLSCVLESASLAFLLLSKQPNTYHAYCLTSSSMQYSSGDTTRSPVRSPSHSHSQHRRPDVVPTRRLSAAIDGLRREGETILWELNSLMTQNSTLEERLQLQAEELDLLCRGLVTLRDQHKTVEQQYKQEAQALRSELEAVQEQKTISRRASNPAMTGHDRRRSPQPDSSSNPGSGYGIRSQSPLQTYTTSRNDPSHHTSRHSLTSSHNYREDRRASYRAMESYSSNPSRTQTPQSPRSPAPSVPHTYSQVPSVSHSPREGYSWSSPRYRPPADDEATPSGSQHEPSLSPNATFVSGEFPTRSRHYRTRP